MNVYLSLSLSIYIYIYTYIYIQREREREMCISLSLSFYIYIYIYIYVMWLRPLREKADPVASGFLASTRVPSILYDDILHHTITYYTIL